MVRDFEVKVIDLCFSSDPRKELAKVLEDWRPDAIGLSVRNLDNGDFMRPHSYVADTAALAMQIRSLSPALLIIGGPAVGIMPIDLLHTLQADYAIAGDGEEALGLLLQSVQGDADTSRLAGVYARKKAESQDSRFESDFGSSGRAGSKTGTSDLGSTTVLPFRPFARVDDVEMLPFAQVANWVSLREYLRYDCPMPVQSKRGCQFACIYCTYCEMEGRQYRLRSPRTVAQEMWETKNRWKVNSFEFVDSTFSHPTEHAMALCEAIIGCRLGAKLQTSGLHPGSTSQELIGLMKRAGFESVVCTPDSGSERVLARLNKSFGLEEIAKTAQWSREKELPMLWSFVFGAPGESEETVRATIRFAEAIFGPKDRLLCTLGLRIYPGTELGRIAVEEGMVSPNANLLTPAFYFSPAIAPARVLSLLDGSKLRRQMVFLTSLQSKLVPFGLRLRHRLRLRGPAYRQVPLLNLVARLKHTGPKGSSGGTPPGSARGKR